MSDQQIAPQTAMAPRRVRVRSADLLVVACVVGAYFGLCSRATLAVQPCKDVMNALEIELPRATSSVLMWFGGLRDLRPLPCVLHLGLAVTLGVAVVACHRRLGRCSAILLALLLMCVTVALPLLALLLPYQAIEAALR